jgi:hypothetical protein
VGICLPDPAHPRIDKIKELYKMASPNPTDNDAAAQIQKEIADRIEAAILLERLRRAAAMSKPLDPTSLPLPTKVLAKN